MSEFKANLGYIVSSRTTWTISQQQQLYLTNKQTNTNDGSKTLVALNARGSHCQPCLSGCRLVELGSLADVHQNLCRSLQSRLVARVIDIHLVSPYTLLGPHPLRSVQPQVACTA